MFVFVKYFTWIHRLLNLIVFCLRGTNQVSGSGTILYPDKKKQSSVWKPIDESSSKKAFFSQVLAKEYECQIK